MGGLLKWVTQQKVMPYLNFLEKIIPRNDSAE